MRLIARSSEILRGFLGRLARGAPRTQGADLGEHQEAPGTLFLGGKRVLGWLGGRRCHKSQIPSKRSAKLNKK